MYFGSAQMAERPRISVVGTSGSGKSTAAALLSRRLGVPHIELDALRHGPGWRETPDEAFRELVAAEIARDGWIIDGNYGVIRDLVWPRATAIVWLDPPLWVVMAQVIWRSFRRLVTRQELWNGNRERFDWHRPEHPIRWAYSTHHQRRAKFEAALDDRWVRLRSRAELRAYLATLPGA